MQSNNNASLRGITLKYQLLRIYSLKRLKGAQRYSSTHQACSLALRYTSFQTRRKFCPCQAKFTFAQDRISTRRHLQPPRGSKHILCCQPCLASGTHTPWGVLRASLGNALLGGCEQQGHPGPRGDPSWAPKKGGDVGEWDGNQTGCGVTTR